MAGYETLSQLLRESFEKYGELMFFPDMTYSAYLESMKRHHDEWAELSISGGDIIVFADEGGRSNLLNILTTLYFGHRLCLIHNRLFLDSSLEKLGIFGQVQCVSCGGITAVVRAAAGFGGALIASTSGTTGAPNLVQHTAANIIENIAAIEDYLCPQAGDTIYLQRNPIYLSVLTGEVLLGIDRGCRFFIPQGAADPKQLIANIRDNHINVFVSVMSYFDMLLPMLRRNADSLQSLRYLQFVGEGGRIGLINDLAEILPHTDVIIGYGLTEAGPRISYMSCRQLEPKQYLVGKLVRGVKARICGDDGMILPVGEKGTVELASPSLMTGYVGCEKTGEWFRTSDYGWLDENGLLYVQGRLDDIAIRNGVKVPLVSVEQAIMRSGMVTGVMAFVVRHHTSGMLRVEVAVTTELSDDGFEERLMRWCRENTDPLLWPQRLYILDSFVFRPNGKLDKVAIKSKAMGESR